MLLRALPDPHAIAPGQTWTVAETAAHLVTALKSYRELLLGTPGASAMLRLTPDADTPTQHSAVHNAAQLAQFSERDLLRLADLLVPSVDAFLAAGVARQDGERILTGTGPQPDPTTFLLLGYGRSSRRSQLVRGRIVAGGRKPWLAVAFERLLTGP